MNTLEMLAKSNWQYIEASAGTGKTFTLTRIYLQALLGGLHVPPRSVEKIVLLTFTRSAASTLKSRLFTLLQEAITQLRTEGTLPEGIEWPAEATSDQRVERLQKAVDALPSAPIGTLHAFCYNILKQYSDCFGLPPDLAIHQLSEAELQAEANKVWYAAQTYDRGRLSNLVRAFFPSPKALYLQLKALLNQRGIQSVQAHEIEDFYQEAEAEFTALSCLLPPLLTETQTLFTLHQTAKNPRRHTLTNLKKWLSQAADFVCFDFNPLRSCSALEYLNPAEFDLPDGPLLESLKRLAHLGRPGELQQKVTLWLVEWFRSSCKTKLSLAGQMSFDELTHHLLNKLGDPAHQSLKGELLQRYSLFLIDEAQDTDPFQIALLNLLCPKENQHQAIFVADPKQAIYQFRGADVFNYFILQKQAQLAGRLQVNWRASSPLVEQINWLFTQQSSPFILPNLDYQPLAAGKKDLEGLQLHGAELPPISYMYIENEFDLDSSKPCTLRHVAQVQAKEIAAYLSASEANLAHWSGDLKQRQVLQPIDLVVLVRTNAEAELMRSALTEESVSAVVCSETLTKEAKMLVQTLLRLARALQSPSTPHSLRSLYIDPLIGEAIKMAFSMNTDDSTAREVNERALMHYLSECRQLSTKNGFASVALAFSNKVGFNRYRLHGEKLNGFLSAWQGALQWLASLEGGLPNLKKIESALIEVLYSSQYPWEEMHNHSSSHAVRVMTWHKAKGLEFPIVWLPFASRFENMQTAFFHNPETHACIWDPTPTATMQACMLSEAQSESLRRFYVAITRASKHCILGIWETKRRNKVYFCPLAYLLDTLPGNTWRAKMLASAWASLEPANSLTKRRLMAHFPEKVCWEPPAVRSPARHSHNERIQSTLGLMHLSSDQWALSHQLDQMIKTSNPDWKLDEEVLINLERVARYGIPYQIKFKAPIDRSEITRWFKAFFPEKAITDLPSVLPKYWVDQINLGIQLERTYLTVLQTNFKGSQVNKIDMSSLPWPVFCQLLGLHLSRQTQGAPVHPIRYGALFLPHRFENNVDAKTISTFVTQFIPQEALEAFSQTWVDCPTLES